MATYLATLYSASGALAIKAMGPFATVEQAQAAAAKLKAWKHAKATDFVAVATDAGHCYSLEYVGERGAAEAVLGSVRHPLDPPSDWE